RRDPHRLVPPAAGRPLGPRVEPGRGPRRSDQHGRPGVPARCRPGPRAGGGGRRGADRGVSDRALVYAAHLPAAGTRPRRARRRDPRLAGERRLTVLWVGSGANGAGSDPQNGNGTERSCPSMGWVTGESLTSASHPVSAVVRLRLLLSGVSRSSCVRWAYGRTVREPE